MFERGKEYKRAGLLDEYGGQQRSGIVTPRSGPYIFLFGGEGDRFGYRDEWEGEIFLYSGQGQEGDQKFELGNKAVRDHLKEGEDLHLFMSVGGGSYRYEGQMAIIGWRDERGPDVNGNDRLIIRFELVPLESLASDDEVEALLDDASDMATLRRLADDDGAERRDPVERLVNARRRSVAVKAYAHARARGRCESCDRDAPFNTSSGRPYLEVHHVARLSDGGPDLPANVIAVCPNCHRRAHYSVDKAAFTERLAITVAEIEARA
ncbi:MAG: HNH endonuclease [Actinobacteria bacterium]|nr:HNH endonuclease [Actinomycetota bacterium]